MSELASENRYIGYMFIIVHNFRPEDSSKVLEVPFCAMNTLHRERLERALAIQGEEAKKPDEIQSEIEELLETVKE